jgi:hypothetical protein
VTIAVVSTGPRDGRKPLVEITELPSDAFGSGNTRQLLELSERTLPGRATLINQLSQVMARQPMSVRVGNRHIGSSHMARPVFISGWLIP